MLDEIKRDVSEDKKAVEPVGLQKLLNIEFDLHGETLRCTVTSSILTMEQQLNRDKACVKMSSPQKYDEMPHMAKMRIFALATCSQCLSDVPAWLNEWIGRCDPLLFSIYEEVATHEREFFQGYMEQGGTDQTAAIVRINSCALT